MVIYKNPAESSTNAIAIADGNNVFHIEENGQIVYGAAPPDTRLNWSCLGLSCSSSSLKFGALGGRISCNDGQVDGDEDQIEKWGSGPVTNPGFGDNGSPSVWSGPPGVYNCVNNVQGDRVRNYNLGSNFQSGAQSIEWGL